MLYWIQNLVTISSKFFHQVLESAEPAAQEDPAEALPAEATADDAVEHRQSAIDEALSAFALRVARTQEEEAEGEADQARLRENDQKIRFSDNRSFSGRSKSYLTISNVGTEALHGKLFSFKSTWFGSSC